MVLFSVKQHCWFFRLCYFFFVSFVFIQRSMFNGSMFKGGYWFCIVQFCFNFQRLMFNVQGLVLFLFLFLWDHAFIQRSMFNVQQGLVLVLPIVQFSCKLWNMRFFGSICQVQCSMFNVQCSTMLNVKGRSLCPVFCFMVSADNVLQTLDSGI